MSTSRLVWKVTRPEAFALSFMCAWFLATLSEATSADRLSVSLVAGLSCLGSSIFHFGAGHKIYSRKTEAVRIKHPKTLVLLGAVVLVMSAVLSWTNLNATCTLIAIFNAAAVSVYSRWLSKWWYVKNIVIAVVCSTPAVMGWMVGTTTHPATWHLIITILCAFLAREIIKDVKDIRANHGFRVTLPMVIGISGALRIAAVATAVGAGEMFLLGDYLWSAHGSGIVLIGAAAYLWFGQKPKQIQKVITVSMAMLALSFV